MHSSSSKSSSAAPSPARPSPIPLAALDCPKACIVLATMGSLSWCLGGGARRWMRLIRLRMITVRSFSSTRYTYEA